MTWEVSPVQWDGIEDQADNFKKWWTAAVQARHRSEGRQQLALTANVLW